MKSSKKENRAAKRSAAKGKKRGSETAKTAINDRPSEDSHLEEGKKKPRKQKKKTAVCDDDAAPVPARKKRTPKRARGGRLAKLRRISKSKSSLDLDEADEPHANEQPEYSEKISYSVEAPTLEQPSSKEKRTRKRKQAQAAGKTQKSQGQKAKVKTGASFDEALSAKTSKGQSAKDKANAKAKAKAKAKKASTEDSKPKKSKANRPAAKAKGTKKSKKDVEPNEEYVSLVTHILKECHETDCSHPTFEMREIESNDLDLSIYWSRQHAGVKVNKQFLPKRTIKGKKCQVAYFGCKTHCPYTNIALADVFVTFFSPGIFLHYMES